MKTLDRSATQPSLRQDLTKTVSNFHQYQNLTNKNLPPKAPKQNYNLVGNQTQRIDAPIFQKELDEFDRQSQASAHSQLVVPQTLNNNSKYFALLNFSFGDKKV